MTDNKCSPVSEVLRQAHAALLKIRSASIAGCEEGYGKPEKWADDLFTSHGDVTAAMKAIEEVLSRDHAQSAQQWQPIETAPRDGSPILVCNSRHQSHAPVVVRWLDEMSNPDTGWCDAATASGDALYYNPNYFDWWMPHPAIPKASSVTSTPHQTRCDGADDLEHLDGMLDDRERG